MEIYTRWVALPALVLRLLNLSPKRRERERREKRIYKKREEKKIEGENEDKKEGLREKNNV